MNDLRRTKSLLLLILGMGLMMLLWQRANRGQLVVYCAHDAVFAEDILRDFERQTGIAVTVKYDTEATKSLGLVEQIIQDAQKPRCDVFWNNEMLGTLDLAERGLLEPYPGEGWKRMPERWRDEQGRWTGFAARLRVKMRNPSVGQVDEPERESLAGLSLDRFAIAKPLYGTTLTHYAVLAQLWGQEKLQAWHRQARERGLREANGNAAVRDLVATGVCGGGYTDTDDYVDAKEAGKLVTAEPVRVGEGATICIPNTVAVIRGTRRGDDARRLTDFLLSARVEVALAKSKSRQIPLGPLDDQTLAALPVEVKEWMTAAKNGYALKSLLPLRNACLLWLKAEYVK